MDFGSGPARKLNEQSTRRGVVDFLDSREQRGRVECFACSEIVKERATREHASRLVAVATIGNATRTTRFPFPSAQFSQARNVETFLRQLQARHLSSSGRVLGVTNSQRL